MANTEAKDAEKASSYQKEGKENEFDVTKCICKSVVVYLDRAEVCRVVKANLHEGENEVVLTNLSNFMDSDSVRVEGKGLATISEVAFQTRHLTSQEESEDKASDLRKRLEEVNLRSRVLETKITRLRKQRQVLDSFADGIALPTSGTNTSFGHHGIKKGGGGEMAPPPSTSKESRIPLNAETIEGMKSFFDLYDQQASKLDEAIYELEQEAKAVSEERAVIDKNLNEMRAKSGKKEARVISVLLDASEDCEIILSVSYVVTQAKWTPKYDIRVFSDDKQMKIMYYGMIQQSSGEDWENTKLSLSTAMPSVGGTVPELGTQKLSFKPNMNVYSSMRAKGMFGNQQQQQQRMNADGFQGLANSSMPFMGQVAAIMPSSPVPEMDLTTTEVRDSITSAVFEIARESSIPADNVGHKVSVAIVDFQPAFQYECVPKKSTYAFLKAKVKNTSQYPLLSGPTNIFLDNNFIAKADLKSVSPGEEFDCSLGIDPGVKVTYKPLHKFREQTGYWTKSQNTTYKQVIVLKNNHKDKVHIRLTDQLPQSTEEKIKVSLLEPVIKKESSEKQGVKSPVRLNKNNNVEWDLEVPSGTTKELVLKYGVEHPINEELDTTEVSAPN